MGRFDNRSKEVFKKDIYFGTQIETYFFSKFLEACKNNREVTIHDHQDNGVCNEGKFVSGVDTSAADYKINITYMGEYFRDLPLEVKWVPTYGRLTLKVNDLKAYVKQRAAILFIYTTETLQLKKPKDYDFQEHTEKIELHKDSLRWGIMLPNDVEMFLNENLSRAEPIFYMGGKLGMVLDQSDFSIWFIEEKF